MDCFFSSVHRACFRHRRAQLIVVAAVVAVLAACGVRYYQRVAALRRCARNALHKPLMGGGWPAIAEAIKYGDEILPFLKSDLAGIDELYGIVAEPIISVLCANPSPASLAFARELYAQESHVHRAAGAAVLSYHGKLDDITPLVNLIDECVQRCVQQIESGAERDDYYWRCDEAVQIALVALGHTRNRAAVPVLTRVVRHGSCVPGFAYQACEAFSYLGDRSAIPVLREFIADPKFLAVKPAFLALISLGDMTAIEPVIDRMSSLSEEDRDYLVEQMEHVTGQKFGSNQAAWKEWWTSVKDKGTEHWILNRPVIKPPWWFSATAVVRMVEEWSQVKWAPVVGPPDK